MRLLLLLFFVVGLTAGLFAINLGQTLGENISQTLAARHAALDNY